MVCPYCDSEYRVMNVSQTCRNCGAQLPSYDELSQQRRVNSQRIVFPERPVGSYKGAGETLLVREDGIVFVKKDSAVPLSEIYDVSFYPGAMSRPGFLCIRKWEQRNVPLVTESIETSKDETTIGFYLADKEKFQNVYVFLKQCADLNHAASPGWREDELLPILGKYKGFYGSMEIRLDAVRFSKKVLFQKRTDRVIAYTEIAKVAFEKGMEKGSGGLWVRSRQDQDIPTEKPNYASVDATAIDFGFGYNERMEQVYRFLQSRAQENEMLRTREAVAQTEQQEPARKSTDTEVPKLEYYYQRYKPDRTEAIKALRIDSGMSFREAKANIDLIFDFYASKQVSASNDSSTEEIICCGQCWSTDVTLGKKGYDFLAGWAGDQALPGSGFMLGMVDADKPQYKCNNCGYTWEP